MAKLGFYPGSVIVTIRPKIRMIAMCFAGCFVISAASAQDASVGCTTTKDCAEQMVRIASDLKAENEILNKRIEELRGELSSTAAQLRQERASALDSMKSKEALHRVGGGNGESALCPQGQYMVGGSWVVTEGGGHGIMSSWAPICRSL